MRMLYTLAWLALLPFAFLYLLWRARLQPEYRRHWRERLGWAPAAGVRPQIWVHAVSVGETRAAAPLIQNLRERYPGHDLLLTHATPTGRETGRALFGESVRQAYLPYDFAPLTWLFLRRARPALGIVMETELWPALFRACHRRGIPLLLLNARLSERSARGYARFRPLARAALHDLTGIAAQTQADAARLRDLGAESVTLTGNIKFDAAPAEPHARDRLRALTGTRFTLLCASTREGEEVLLLDALSDLPRLNPDWLLLIVPRHPQRFDQVAALLDARGLAWQRRSEEEPLRADTAVLLGDSMGEMAAYYAAADLCYVGGSLLPLGGQNLIEAAAAGCPALLGPHTWNFMQAAEEAIACGAALRIEDAAGLRTAAESLHAHPERLAAMQAAGLAFAAANRGATARTLTLIESIYPRVSG